MGRHRRISGVPNSVSATRLFELLGSDTSAQGNDSVITEITQGEPETDARLSQVKRDWDIGEASARALLQADPPMRERLDCVRMQASAHGINLRVIEVVSPNCFMLTFRTSRTKEGCAQVYCTPDYMEIIQTPRSHDLTSAVRRLVEFYAQKPR